MRDILVESHPSDAQLDALGVRHWAIWECEVSEFPWHYDQEEVCFLLKGKVIVTPVGGEPVSFGAGDMVTFAANLSCRWQVIEAVRKHYQFR